MIYLTSDHAGFEAKSKLKEFLKNKGFEVKDFGPFEYDKDDDYSDYSIPAAKELLQDPKNIGIFMCGAAQGVCISANKVKGIYAALAWNTEVARLSKEHNNTNVLCMPARQISQEEINEIALIWLNTKFSNEERHIRRLNKVKQIE